LTKQTANAQEPSLAKRWYSRILLIAVLLGVSYYIFIAFNDLAKFDYQLNWTYLFLSFFFTLIAYLFQLMIWLYLARSFGIHLSFLTAANSWSLSQLGKYLPGKIGLFLIRMDTHPEIPKRIIAVATGVEFITAMASSCLLVLISISFIPKWTSSSSIRWIALSLVCLFLIILYPPILKKLTDLTFRLIKREPLNSLPSYGLLLKLVGFNMLVGIPYGLGLFFAFNCFYPIGWNYFLIITGVYYAAALAGVAAIFAPAGIGVREGIVFLILPALISKPVVIFATILTRIIITLAEIFLALLFFTLERYSAQKKYTKNK
jgi:glycosyltransferase 2 family protein